MSYIKDGSIRIGKITDNVGTISFKLKNEHSIKTGAIFMRLYCDVFHVFFDEDLILNTDFSNSHNVYIAIIRDIKAELVAALSTYFENEKTGNQK